MNLVTGPHLAEWEASRRNLYSNLGTLSPSSKGKNLELNWEWASVINQQFLLRVSENNSRRGRLEMGPTVIYEPQMPASGGPPCSPPRVAPNKPSARSALGGSGHFSPLITRYTPATRVRWRLDSEMGGQGGAPSGSSRGESVLLSLPALRGHLHGLAQQRLMAPLSIFKTSNVASLWQKGHCLNT